MSARCGERNSSLTRTRASAGGRVAGVPPALPQRTRESRVPSGSRARMSASAEWLVRDQQLAFGLLQLVALLSSHPLFYRRLAWRDSLVFISPAGVRTRARMGLRPLEIERFISFEKCVKMIKFFGKICNFSQKSAKIAQISSKLGLRPSRPRLCHFSNGLSLAGLT